jgi:hypothetical protein
MTLASRTSKQAEGERAADQLLQHTADGLVGTAVLQTGVVEGALDSDDVWTAHLPAPSDPQGVDFRLPDELAEAAVPEDREPDPLAGVGPNGFEPLRQLALSRDAPGRRRLPARLRHEASLHVSQP